MKKSEHAFDPERLDSHSKAAQHAEHDPSLNEAWLRFARAIRSALTSSVEFDGSAEKLAQLASQAEALEQEISHHAGGRRIPLYGREPDAAPDDIGASLPFSPIAGHFNPAAPPVSFRIDGQRVIGEVNFASTYQGAPGLVHGAIISATYDELLAMANLAQKTSGPTARLTVRYRKPTPLHTDLRFEAWVEDTRERYVLSRGRCYAGEELVSDAEGLFARISRTPRAGEP